MAPIGFSQYIRVFGITGNDFAGFSGLEGFQKLFFHPCTPKLPVSPR